MSGYAVPVLMLAASLVAIAPGAARAAAGEKTLIRLKPQPQPVEYWLRSQETQLRETPAGARTPAEFGKLELVKQTISATSDGNIEIEGQLQGREAVINKRRLSDIWAPQKYTVRLSPRNERLDAAAKGDPNALMIPVFPAEAVPAKHTWKTQIPATADFPFPVTVTHVFHGVAKVQDVPCAIINSAGQGGGKDPRTGVTVRARFESNLAVAVAEGLLVKSVAASWVDTKFPQPTKEGHQVLRRLDYRIVQRRQPGDVPANVLPASEQDKPRAPTGK